MATTPNPEQIQYMQAHIGESLVPSIFISSGICVGASSVCVVLRYFARRSSIGGLGKDDYTLFVAYILYVLYITGFSFSTRYGQGRHILLVGNARAFTINNIINMCLYILGMVFVKHSILLLYHRIFPRKIFKHALIVLSAIIIAWALAALFASVFICYPISTFWDPSVHGNCIDYGLVTLIIGTINIMIDFLMLGFPMPVLWKLQMCVRRKIMLSIVFAVGCIACVISIARLFYARRVVSSWDSSWDNVMGGVLSGLEMCIGIVACCAITYRPLIEKMFGISGSRKGTDEKSVNRQYDRIEVQHEVIVMSRIIRPSNTTGEVEISV